MYREIMIGKESVPMKSNAATPIRYRQVFHKDILKELSEAEKNTALAMDSISQLAYIMAMTGSGADMSQLNEEKYIAWLEQFETFDFIEASEAIVDVYLGNTTTTSEAKKKA